MTGRNITIIGAGLVGSLLAVLFRKRGFDVTLYEKRQDLRFKGPTKERSINLVITSRGLYGLEQAGFFGQAIELSVPVFGRMIHSKTGAQTYQAYGQKNECNLSVSRAELNKFLVNAAEEAGAKIYFDHELQTMDLDEKKMNFLSAGKKIEASYDLLFGADGAGSLVRKNLNRLFPEEFVETLDWLEADYLELFLPADDNQKPLMEKNALHIWPRGSHMLMALANLDGSFTVTLYLPKTPLTDNGPSFQTIKTAQGVQKLFRSEFADAISLIPNYIDEFLENPKGKLGTVRTSKWVYKDSVALLGDAAHAIVPFFGQGMNAGFEDCTNLLEILDQNADWSTTLAKFEEMQIPNANAIADMALENWVEMRDRVGDEGFLLRKKVESKLEQKFPKVYKSRYGMVTYTRIPYSLAQKAGVIQDEILTELCVSLKSIDELSLATAEKLLNDKLKPFLDEHSLANHLA